MPAADSAAPDRSWAPALVSWALLAPALLFLAAWFLVPLSRVVWFSLSDPVLSLDNYTELFSSSFYLRVLGRTFWLALLVTLSCLLLAYPLSYYAIRRGGWRGQTLLLVTALGFWISFIIRTYAWMVILGNRGPLIGLARALGIDPPPRILFTSLATGIGMTHILLPFMVMALYAAMARIDPLHDRAALSLGATPARSFWHVFLPQSLPGLINGCLLVFIFCLGFYITPAVLGSPQDQTVAGLIGLEMNSLMEWGVASAMAMLLVIATLVALLVYDRILGLERLWT